MSNAKRVSAPQRLQTAIVAEKELFRYKDNNALWFKHVLGIDLDPLQILRMEMLDKEKTTVAWDARRMRKSTTHFLHALKALVIKAHSEGCAVTPRQAQADKNVREYMTDQIRGSEILDSYIGYRGGRKQLTDTSFTFANKSLMWTAGVMGEVDGSGVTYFLLDEIEDMDYDRLVEKFLPMLGQTQKLGSTEVADRQLRALGVIKGSGIRKVFLDEGFYPLTQPGYPNGVIIGGVDMGIAMGILDADWLEMQKRLMSPEAWAMQMECREIESKNTVQTRWIRAAMNLGLRMSEATDIGKPVQPMPGVEYKKRGLVAFGYDHLGHGENPEASKSVLVVSEMVGDYVWFPFVKIWPAWCDESIIKNDLVAFWRYFRPDSAAGDAFGIGLLTDVNKILYRERLTSIDISEIHDGKSSESTWPDWPFSPIRFLGGLKHQMASALANVFRNHKAILPWFDESEEPEPGLEEDFRTVISQLGNVRAEPAKNGGLYPSYKIDDKSIGDDGFDAAMASVFKLAGRIFQMPTEIVTINRPRQLPNMKQSRLNLPGVRSA